MAVKGLDFRGIKALGIFFIPLLKLSSGTYIIGLKLLFLLGNFLTKLLIFSKNFRRLYKIGIKLVNKTLLISVAYCNGTMFRRICGRGNKSVLLFIIDKPL